MGVNAQDRAELNPPVDSQTVYTGQACKTLVCDGPEMRAYANPWPLVRGTVSVQCQVLAPLVRARWPAPARPSEGVRPGEGGRARSLAGGAGRRGKAAGAAGKARGRTVINSAAVSYQLRGNWPGNTRFRGGKALTVSRTSAVRRGRPTRGKTRLPDMWPLPDSDRGWTSQRTAPRGATSRVAMPRP